MIKKGDSVRYEPDSSGKPYKMGNDEKSAFLSKIASQIEHMKKAARKKESIKVINGKKYKPIKESVEPTVLDPIKQPMKEVYKRIGGK